MIQKIQKEGQSGLPLHSPVSKTKRSVDQKIYFFPAFLSHVLVYGVLVFGFVPLRKYSQTAYKMLWSLLSHYISSKITPLPFYMVFSK